MDFCGCSLKDGAKINGAVYGDIYSDLEAADPLRKHSSVRLKLGKGIKASLIMADTLSFSLCFEGNYGANGRGGGGRNGRHRSSSNPISHRLAVRFFILSVHSDPEHGVEGTVVSGP